MPTKTPKKSSKGRASSYQTIELKKIVGNDFQSRHDGALPTLAKLGYSVFDQDEIGDEKLSADKEPIMTMLLSGEPEKMDTAVGLIEEHEEEIVELANSFVTAHGQLQPAGLTESLDDEGKKTGMYLVVWGMRRCLAKAYQHAKTGGEIPATVEAQIREYDPKNPNQPFYEGYAENRFRKSQSPIDEAKYYDRLRKGELDGHKYTVQEIGKKESTNPQNVRNRLQLLRLPKEIQSKVHDGKVGMVEALKYLSKQERGDGDKNGKDSPPEKSEDRIRLPTLKQALATYNATEKPEDMPEEEWNLSQKDDVRRYVAHFAKVEFLTFREMKKAKAEEAKAALQAAEAAAAAQEAEDKE